MAASFQFKALLTEDGWLENAVIHVDAVGRISNISPGENPNTEKVNGYALPGFQNAHSHAFQYAMAGLAELHEGNGIPDDFWSWRTAMYDLALQVSPDDLEAIATMLYAEMIRHGYTEVAEFHYIHHDKNGGEYSNIAELGERLISAAQTAGINITLVPMFYQKGGFGKPAEEKQRRFISTTIEDYYRLLHATEALVKKYDHVSLGMGIHSLRAVEGEDIITVCNDLKKDIPFHIHVSEQLKEIEYCLNFYGKRPVEWLMQNVEMNENYHLVHATHLNDAEVKGIATVKANVVLCPTTEGNLGDGIFRFHDFKKYGGNWSIGTDSHVGLNPLEELRMLDYGQRLTTYKRTTFFEEGNGDSGFNAIKIAWKTGRKAMGKPSDSFFAIGEKFDAVVFKASAPLLASSGLKHICNTIVYSSDATHILGTFVNGKWVSRNNELSENSSIKETFITKMKHLGSRL